jgi:hypothetical protein
MNSNRHSYVIYFQKIESLADIFPYISVPSKSIDTAIYSKSYGSQITGRIEGHLVERKAHTTLRRCQLLVGQVMPKYGASVSPFCLLIYPPSHLSIHSIVNRFILSPSTHPSRAAFRRRFGVRSRPTNTQSRTKIK